MTVIAWDGHKLAGDRLMATGGGLAGSVTKVFKINNHLVGGAGSASQVKQFIDWFASGAVIAEFPQNLSRGGDDEHGGGFSVLVITPSREIRIYQDSPIPIIVEDPFIAIGSGAEYAMTAMACGRSAQEAVLLTGELSVFCGRGCDVLEHDPA